eukprot:COSAG04_NODE_13496_length_603_cov_1.706349_2_plen_128_part_01
MRQLEGQVHSRVATKEHIVSCLAVVYRQGTVQKKECSPYLIKLPDDMPPLGWAKLIPGLVMSTKPSRFTVTLSRVDGVRSGAALSTGNSVGRFAMQCGGAAATHFAARCAGSGSLLFLPFFAPAAGSA